MSRESEPSIWAEPRSLKLLFYVLVLLNCAWVLSLPLFPSQDGPVHLYYLSVIDHLLAGSQLFSQYFAIRHPLPPYSFEYLLLFALSKVANPLLAEQITICLYIVIFCLGFRFVVTAVSPRAGIVSFFGIPLSLNWILGMGFISYLMALGMSLVALGLWLRALKSSKLAFYLGFLATILLILFTHPVPLLILIVFIWSQLFLDVLQHSLRERSVRQSFLAMLDNRRKQLIFLFLSTASIGYIFIFVNSKRTGEDLHHRLIQGGMLREALRLHPLVMTFGTTGSSVYRLALYVLLGAAFFFGFKGFRERVKSFSLTASDLLLSGAALLTLLYPFVPRTINGSDFFADRLLIYIWLFAIVGASAHLTLTSRKQYATAAIVTCLVLTSLFVCDRQVRPASKVLAEMEHADLHPNGTRGIFIYSPVEPGEQMLTFNPYFWSSARYFRKSNAIMMNAPWLELPILPVAPTQKSFTSHIAPWLMNHPDFFAGELIKSEKMREFVSSNLDFILFIGYADRDPRVVDNVLKQHWPHQWNCNRPGWYAVCSE